jgi:hypothetical protein
MTDDTPPIDQTRVGPGGLDAYAAKPTPSSFETASIGAPQNDAERAILKDALLGKGGRLAYAEATRKIMAAREAAPGPQPAAPAAAPDGKAEIAAEVQNHLAAASTRFASMTEAERGRAVDQGRAHLLKTLFRGSEAKLAEATAAIEAAGHKVDGAVLANPMAFQRAWLASRGGTR